MTQPDSTTAFDADAQRGEDVTALKQEIARLKNQGGSQGDDYEIIDPNAPTSEVDVSAANEATVAGDTFRFHTPKPQALMAFGIGTADRRNGEMVMKSMRRFLSFHLLEEDFDRLLERMSNPQDDFDDEAFGDLMNAVVETANTSAEAQAPKNGPRR